MNRKRLALMVAACTVSLGLMCTMVGAAQAETSNRPHLVPDITPRPLPMPVLNSHPVAYHWDGWQTDYISSGEYATLNVIPARGVIDGTQDFMAVRMMAKTTDAHGQDKWLEVGYATNGMTNGGTFIYTFDTGSGQWHFYPEYPLHENMTVRVGLFSNKLGDWTAYLFYNNNWFALVTCVGAGVEFAHFEYYVETHYDQGDSNHIHITVPSYPDAITTGAVVRNIR